MSDFRMRSAPASASTSFMNQSHGRKNRPGVPTLSFMKRIESHHETGNRQHKQKQQQHQQQHQQHKHDGNHSNYGYSTRAMRMQRECQQQRNRSGTSSTSPAFSSHSSGHGQFQSYLFSQPAGFRPPSSSSSCSSSSSSSSSSCSSSSKQDHVHNFDTSHHGSVQPLSPKMSVNNVPPTSAHDLTLPLSPLLAKSPASHSASDSPELVAAVACNARAQSEPCTPQQFGSKAAAAASSAAARQHPAQRQQQANGSTATTTHPQQAPPQQQQQQQQQPMPSNRATQAPEQAQHSKPLAGSSRGSSNNSAAVTIDISAVQTQTQTQAQANLLHAKRYSSAHMPPKSPNTPPPNHNLTAATAALSAPNLAADSVLSATVKQLITSNTAVTTPMSRTPPHHLNPAYSAKHSRNSNTTASSTSESRSVGDDDDDDEQEAEAEEEERGPRRRQVHVTIDTTPNLSPIPFKRRSQTPRQLNSRIPDFNTHVNRSSRSNTIGMKTQQAKRFSEVYSEMPQMAARDASKKKSGRHKQRASDTLHTASFSAAATAAATKEMEAAMRKQRIPSFQMVSGQAADGGHGVCADDGDVDVDKQRQLMWTNLEQHPRQNVVPADKKMKMKTNTKKLKTTPTTSAQKRTTTPTTTAAAKVMCICGQRLFKVPNTSQLWICDDDDGNDVDGNMNCSECGVHCPPDTSLYHCRRKAHAAHPNGYHLCIACGKKQKRASNKSERKKKKKVKKKRNQWASDGLFQIREQHPGGGGAGFVGVATQVYNSVRGQSKGDSGSSENEVAYTSKLSIEYNTEEFHVSSYNPFTPKQLSFSQPPAAADNEDNFSLNSYSLNTEKRLQLDKPLPFPVKRGGKGARGRGVTAPLKSDHPWNVPSTHRQRVSRPPPSHRHTATVSSMRDLCHDQQQKYQRYSSRDELAELQQERGTMVAVLDSHSKKAKKQKRRTELNASRQSFTPASNQPLKKKKKKKAKKIKGNQQQQQQQSIFPFSSQSVPKSAKMQSQSRHHSQVNSDGLDGNEYAIEVEEDDGLIGFIFVSSQ